LLKLASLAARLAVGGYDHKVEGETISTKSHHKTTLKSKVDTGDVVHDDGEEEEEEDDDDTFESSLGLLSNGYGSLDGADAGYHLESRFSEQVILLKGGGTFMDPLIPPDVTNQSTMSSWYDSLSWIHTQELMKLPSWLVPYEILQRKLLLPEMYVVETNGNVSDDDDSQLNSKKDSAGDAVSGDGSHSSLKYPPTYIALPMRTNQWHPSFDKVVAQILMHGGDNLHLYVFAEFSSVEYASADDQLSRHDIHQVCFAYFTYFLFS
jgi:hypothetical protein